VEVDAADDDFCYLTTRGRVTGEPHEVEIWFAVHGSTVYALAGGGRRSDWVRNVEVDPAVTIRVRDRAERAIGHVVGDPAEDRVARSLLFDKYEPRHPGLSSWRESALPVAFDLEHPQA
jgi:deazaflavin-dependent oxidoreductase (nitroreductase family)